MPKKVGSSGVLPLEPSTKYANYMITEFVGRIYPNGEFGVARMKKMTGEAFKPLQALTVITEDVRWNLAMIRLHGIQAALMLAAIAPPPPFDSSMLPNSHSDLKRSDSKPRSRRGLGGITSHGRKLVRNGAFLIEKEYPKQCLSFLTLTVPSISVEESVKLGSEWAQIVRVFVQRLTRALKNKGLPGEIVGCVEIQEKRFAKSHVVAPHLHLLFVGRHRYQSWSIAPADFRAMWRSALTSRCPWLSDRDFSSVENVAHVKSSAEGYLGKYMTKGASLVADLGGESRSALPTAWYVCTNRLREKVRKRTLHSRAVGSALMQVIEDTDLSGIVYVRTVELEIVGGRKISIGYYGKLTLAERSSIERIVRPEN